MARFCNLSTSASAAAEVQRTFTISPTIGSRFGLAMTVAIYPPFKISTVYKCLHLKSQSFTFLLILLERNIFLRLVFMVSPCFHHVFSFSKRWHKFEDLTLACPLEFGISQWNPRLEPRLAWVVGSSRQNCHGIPPLGETEKPMTLSTTNHTAHGPTKVKPLLSQFLKFVMH